jgi:hypothetical protein
MNEGLGACSMVNGPFCAPLGMRTQSQYLYSQLMKRGDEDRVVSPRDIAPIFVDEKLHYVETLQDMFAKEIALRRKSDDAGRGEVGIQVIETQYWFMLKFFTYDWLV